VKKILTLMLIVAFVVSMMSLFTLASCKAQGEAETATTETATNEGKVIITLRMHDGDLLPQLKKYLKPYTLPQLRKYLEPIQSCRDIQVVE